MHIRKLILQPFRNFSHTELKLRDEGAIIVAPNASGKSNILEAISFLSIGKSVRGIRDREAVPHGGKHFEIRAILYDGQREHELRLCYVHGKGKQAFLDGAALGRISDLLSIKMKVVLIMMTISVVFWDSMQMGKASMPAYSLNNKAFPSMTGIEAVAPILPSPSTADPSVIMATVFFLIVSS